MDKKRHIRYRENGNGTAVGLTPFFFLFLIFYLVRLLQLGIRIPVFGNFRLEFILGLLVAVPGVVLLTQEKKLIRPTSFNLGLAFAFLMLLMTPLSVDPEVSWGVFSNIVLKDLMVGICIAAFLTSVMRMKWFIFSHLLGFAKMAEEGVVGSITGGLIWENQGTLRLHGSTPRYDHPNSFGGTQAGTLPFLGELFRINRSQIVRILLVLQAVAAIDVIIHTGSRTTYFAMIMWIGYLFISSKNKFRSLIIICATALVLSVATPPQYVERFSQIFSQKDKEGGSVETRKEIYTDALEIFLSHPLGVGVGAFPSIRKQTFGRSQDTHNLYLEVATNLGVQGLILFTALIIAMFRDLRRLSTEIGNSIAGLRLMAADRADINSKIRDLEFLRAVANSLKGFLVIRLGCGLFGHDLYEAYWWFAIGLIVALTRLSAEIADLAKSPGGTTRRADSTRIAKAMQRTSTQP